MAHEIPQIPQFTPQQFAYLKAQTKIKDVFEEREWNGLTFFPPNVGQYLLDYFIFVDDLRFTVNEEIRRCYQDYSFVVVPINKAFESYLFSLMTYVFGYKLTETSPIGNYVNAKPDERKTKLDELKKKLSWTINEDKWNERWKGLGDCWRTNRNPLTHVQGEQIKSLAKAENIANAILREMDLSLKLFTKEFLDPLIELARKNKEAEEAASKASAEVIQSQE